MKKRSFPFFFELTLQVTRGNKESIVVLYTIRMRFHLSVEECISLLFGLHWTNHKGKSPQTSQRCVN